MSDENMMAHVLDCLKDFVTEFNLDVSKRADKYGFHLEFENKNDWLYISYATHHPYDYPFFFDVRYCKQKFIIKDSLLYRTDTKEITPLWSFNDKLNVSISGIFEEDIPIITECCKITADMFSYYQAMSDDEYLNNYTETIKYGDRK